MPSVRVCSGEEAPCPLGSALSFHRSAALSHTVAQPHLGPLTCSCSKGLSARAPSGPRARGLGLSTHRPSAPGTMLPHPQGPQALSSVLSDP